jgi:DNA-directed RNA polymerase subunit RPC12/RpoP
MNGSHKRTAVFKCDVCGKEVSRMQTLKVHKESVHEKLKYSCTICRKQLSTVLLLRRHVNVIHKFRMSEQ